MKNIKCYDSNGNVLEYMYQWDSNQTIVLKNLGLSSAPNCHFSNRKRNNAVIVESALAGADIVVSVPNYLLQDPYPIIIYVNCECADGSTRTLYRVVIPVVPRLKPLEYDDSNIEIIGTDHATAECEHIVHGRTAYARGEKLVGSMGKALPSVSEVKEHSGYIALQHTYPNTRYVDPTSGIMLLSNPSDYGDASVSDVVSGKTFTSKDGLRRVGTAIMGTGFSVSDDGNGNVTINSASVDDDGSGNIVFV